MKFNNLFLSKIKSDLLGKICIICAMICFTSGDVIIKYLNNQYPLHQVIFIRSIVALLFTLILLTPNKGKKLFLTNNLLLQFFRGFFYVLANLFYFSSFIIIPLGEATALTFVAPIMISLFSIFFLK